MTENTLKIEPNSEWSYEQRRVIVSELRKRGRGYQVVYATYDGQQCLGIYKSRLRDFLKHAKPL